MRFCIFIFLAFFSACSIQKKDESAFNRVTAKRPLLERVKPIIMDLYPCANDTLNVYLPGRIDSIPYEVPVLDKELMKNIIDSIGMEYQGQCDDAIQKAFLKGRASVKIYKKNPDTIKITIVDQTLVKSKDLEIARLNSELINKDRKYNQEQKYLGKIIAFISLAIVIVLIFRGILKKFNLL